MKFILHSVAIHLAIRVLPVPGGPKNRTPLRGLTSSSNISGCFWGRATVFYISFSMTSIPPTSA